MKSGSVMLTVMLLCFSVVVYADNVWIGPQGNAGHTGYVPITTNPANYHLLWDKKLIPANIVNARFGNVILDHTIFYACDEYTGMHKYIDSILIAVDTATGNVKWKTVLNPELSINFEHPLHYVNHALYVSMGNKKVNTSLYNYDAQTGKLLQPAQTFYSGWIVASDNANFYAITNKDQLLQLNPSDLSAKWSVPYKNDKYTAVRGYALSQHYFMEQTDSSNTILNFFNFLNGKQDTSVNVTDVPESDLIRYPVIDDETNAAYVVLGRWASASPILYAIDLTQHAIRWSLPNQNGKENPVVANNVVYSVSDDAKTLNAIDAKAGVILWTWQLTDDEYINTFEPPVVTNDAIFFVSKNHTYGVSLTTHQTVFEVNKAGFLSIGDNKLFINSYNQENGSDDYVAAYALS